MLKAKNKNILGKILKDLNQISSIPIKVINKNISTKILKDLKINQGGYNLWMNSSNIIQKMKKIIGLKVNK